MAEQLEGQFLEIHFSNVMVSVYFGDVCVYSGHMFRVIYLSDEHLFKTEKVKCSYLWKTCIQTENGLGILAVHCQVHFDERIRLISHKFLKRSVRQSGSNTRPLAPFLFCSVFFSQMSREMAVVFLFLFVGEQGLRAVYVFTRKNARHTYKHKHAHKHT